MDIVIPPTFPQTEFQAFGIAAIKFFPTTLSDEALFDSEQKRQHFEWSWQAVRYRYRSCVECNDEFKALFVNASEQWKAGLEDEELTYRLERCIYQFFMSGLSVFDSLAFCLYFLGNAIKPGAFPHVTNPRKITRPDTSKAFNVSFPHAEITKLLTALPGDAGFSDIDVVRNLVGHRLSGRRSTRSSIKTHADGTCTGWHEETWYIPGAARKLSFDEKLLERYLGDITRLLSSLAAAAQIFAETP